MLITYALGALVLVVVLLVGRTFKVVKEYERGVEFTLGQFEAVMEPGLRTVIPLIWLWERRAVTIQAEGELEAAHNMSRRLSGEHPQRRRGGAAPPHAPDAQQPQ